MANRSLPLAQSHHAESNFFDRQLPTTLKSLIGHAYERFSLQIACNPLEPRVIISTSEYQVVSLSKDILRRLPRHTSWWTRKKSSSSKLLEQSSSLYSPQSSAVLSHCSPQQLHVHRPKHIPCPKLIHNPVHQNPADDIFPQHQNTFQTSTNFGSSHSSSNPHFKRQIITSHQAHPRPPQLQSSPHFPPPADSRSVQTSYSQTHSSPPLAHPATPEPQTPSAKPIRPTPHPQRRILTHSTQPPRVFRGIDVREYNPHGPRVEDLLDIPVTALIGNSDKWSDPGG